MRINHFFDTIFCITLELLKNDSDHPERLKDSIREFQKHGIAVELVDGIDGREFDIDEPMSSDGDSVVRKADYGCTLSHKKVAQLAKERGLRNYLVFEDDVKLSDNFNNQFSEYMQGLPMGGDISSPWKMIYLGGDNKEPGKTALSPHIRATTKTFTTHAYGVNNIAYDDVIAALSVHEKVDINLNAVHKEGGCYIMDPVIAGQRPGYSYILDRFQPNDHKFFKV